MHVEHLKKVRVYMDYMELVKKSVSNAWNYKFLWLFGFFVSVSNGFGGFHGIKEDIDIGDWTDRWDLGWFSFDPAILVFLAMAAFAAWVLFWVMSVVCEGSLIHGISRKELNLPVTFADCWSVGLGKFFRLLGIILLATLAVLFAILSLLLFIVPSYFAHVAFGIILTILAIPILIVIILVSICVEGWAIRFAVLNNERWLDAIGKGWHLFQHNIGRTLGVAFSSLLSQLVLWCLLIIGMLILAIPFIIVGMVNPWLGVIPGVGLGLLIIILSSAYFGVFASSVWTLGFMQMTGWYGPQAAEVADTTPPAAE
jgi:hypothetical protein